MNTPSIFLMKDTYMRVYVCAVCEREGVYECVCVNRREREKERERERERDLE